MAPNPQKPPSNQRRRRGTAWQQEASAGWEHRPWRCGVRAGARGAGGCWGELRSLGACGSQAGRGPCLSETTWRAALGGGVEISRRHEEAGANQRPGHGRSAWSRPWAQRGRGHGGGHVHGLGDCPMRARHWAETRCDLTLRMPRPTAATPRLCILVTPAVYPAHCVLLLKPRGLIFLQSHSRHRRPD